MMKRSMAALVLVLLVGFLVLFIAEECHAQDYMERTGIEGLFQGRPDAAGRGPNRWQMVLGIVAFPVMFAVVKWL